MAALNDTHAAHRHDIVDQFTRQAEAFVDKHRSHTDVLALTVEMVSVAARDTVLDVACAFAQLDKTDGYNVFEKLRDPSHTRAMPLDELLGLMQQSGLAVERTRSYWWEVELEAQLRASAPRPGNEDRLRQMALDDLDRDRLGMNVHRHGDQVIIGYPTTIVVARKSLDASV